MTTTTKTSPGEVKPHGEAAFRKQWDACLADPPWPKQGGEKHYDTMSLADIQAMTPAIQSLMKPDSWMFLWTTVGLEEIAKQILGSWGYRYENRIIWCKPNRFGFGDPRIGIRRSTEVLLVGTRGNVRSHFRSQQDWFSSPAGLHSEKPLEQWAILRRMIGPDATVLEMFAREKFADARHGFWGNELETCDVSLLPWGYPVPADFTTALTPGDLPTTTATKE
ncbi:MT-A70 family methyltransferase [Microbacterium sp. 10M-3C3]|jgi:N6-adenosine-specific RNA methylase IME4|uniref:MT-A70 family methyltransferase n=1 Tax=Microbacterium sp. 10M-3C3 TaxID=2483401 RepID=UPI000F62F55A|nr:MT-A70 family methyltransferase [Microbacterium sp. 10M-3C3]